METKTFPLKNILTYQTLKIGYGPGSADSILVLEIDFSKLFTCVRHWPHSPKHCSSKCSTKTHNDKVCRPWPILVFSTVKQIELTQIFMFFCIYHRLCKCLLISETRQTSFLAPLSSLKTLLTSNLSPQRLILWCFRKPSAYNSHC